jgi:hypothetical protein
MAEYNSLVLGYFHLVIGLGFTGRLYFCPSGESAQPGVVCTPISWHLFTHAGGIQFSSAEFELNQWMVRVRPRRIVGRPRMAFQLVEILRGSGFF